MIKPIDENMDLVVKFLASWVDKTTEIKYRIKIHTTQGILKICISNILRLYESLNNVSLKHGISHYETAIIQYIQRQLANILPSQTAISKETFESAYTTILKYIKCRKNNLSKNNKIYDRLFNFLLDNKDEGFTSYSRIITLYNAVQTKSEFMINSSGNSAKKLLMMCRIYNDHPEIQTIISVIHKCNKYRILTTTTKQPKHQPVKHKKSQNKNPKPQNKNPKSKPILSKPEPISKLSEPESESESETEPESLDSDYEPNSKRSRKSTKQEFDQESYELKYTETAIDLNDDMLLSTMMTYSKSIEYYELHTIQGSQLNIQDIHHIINDKLDTRTYFQNPTGYLLLDNVIFYTESITNIEHYHQIDIENASIDNLIEEYLKYVRTYTILNKLLFNTDVFKDHSIKQMIKLRIHILNRL